MILSFLRYTNRMNKQDFKNHIFSLSESIYPMVVRMLGNTYSAEDAIQEIMIKLWEKRNRIEKHPNIKGLVILTARNYCIDVLRKHKNATVDISNHLKKVKTNNDNNLEWSELNNMIHNILQKLPQQQKEVFVMRDLDGYQFKEIAVALELKVEHVRVLVSRARKFIGVELEKIYNYEQL